MREREEAEGAREDKAGTQLCQVQTLACELQKHFLERMVAADKGLMRGA